MAESRSERVRIAAPPERCYEVAIDYERYPEWARDVKEVTIKERDAEERGSVVFYRAAAMGKSFSYTLEYDYSGAPHSFSWHLLEGDRMRQLDGTYRFEPDDDGTRVHYDLTIDLTAPLPGLLKRRAAGMIMGTALRELKKAVERL
jgi:uncharacterized protein YndB with AHSA1/START domain